MNFQDVLAKFPNAKKTGDGYIAKCNAHDDSTPSLSIKEGDDGRTLLKCRAGCPTEKVCASVGLKLADLFAEKSAPVQKRIVANYPYHDASDKLVFEVVRYEPKTFRQRQPDSKGGWIHNTDGVQKVLFRLPEILRDIKRALPVFVCEGEKDALAMVQKKLSATCNPGGAGKWLDSFSETLRDADVVIIADKDKAGRDHAQLVASKLHGVAKSVRVIELPDTNGKPVKDAADFFNAKGEAAQVLEIAEAAPQWTPAQLPTELKLPSLQDRLDARLFSQANKPEEPTPRFYLAGIGICTAGNLTTISAQEKAGKSAAIGAMIASTFADEGRDCLNFKSSNPNGLAVVHLDTEQTPFDHWQLIDRALRRGGASTAPAWLRSACVTGFSVRDIRESIRLSLDQAAQKFGGVHAFILDGDADAVADVNDPAESNDFVAELHALAIQYICPFIGVIHLNPGSETKTRGHLGSQLVRKSETNLKLEKDADGVTAIWADKNRRAPILKKSAPCFAWSDEHKMHVAVADSGEIRQTAEAEQVTEQAHEAFRMADKTGLHYAEFIAALRRVPGIKSDSTAERIYRKAKALGIVKKNIVKQWEMA